jgi:hypothetical protein
VIHTIFQTFFIFAYASLVVAMEGVNTTVVQDASLDRNVTTRMNTTVDMNATHTVGFVYADNHRDTVSLIISCLATIVLCIYTAIHLNIPPQGESYPSKFWRLVKWGVIGLLTPELVLYTALNQRISANLLFERIRHSEGLDPLRLQCGPHKKSEAIHLLHVKLSSVNISTHYSLLTAF